MTRAGERWASWFALSLEKAEGEAALGDLAEANASDREALGQIFGLVVRRQLNVWKDWRPWLALIGIASVGGLLLDGMTVVMGADYWVRSQFGAPYENGLTAHQNAILVLSGLIAEASWSWVSGLLAGVLARKATWLVGLGVSCYAVWPFVRLVCFLPRDWHAIGILVFLSALLLRVCFLLPMLAGLRRGKRAGVGLRSAVWWSVWLISVTAWMTWTSGWWQEAMVRWSEGAWHPGEAWPIRGLRYLFLSWPAGYLIALAAWERRTVRSNSI